MDGESSRGGVIKFNFLSTVNSRRCLSFTRQYSAPFEAIFVPILVLVVVALERLVVLLKKNIDAQGSGELD